MNPKIVTKPSFKVAGLDGYFTRKNRIGIPKLWQRFMKSVSKIKNRKGQLVFGMIHEDISADLKKGADFVYMACVEVDSLDGLPRGIVGREIPASKFAVFTHRGGVDQLPKTHSYIWGTWLPESQHLEADVPCFEVYDDRFKPDSAESEFDIYVPIQ